MHQYYIALIDAISTSSTTAVSKYVDVPQAKSVANNRGRNHQRAGKTLRTVSITHFVSGVQKSSYL